MSQGRPAPVESSRIPDEGWHCSHFYYRFNRAVLKQLSEAEIAAGKHAVEGLLDPQGEEAPERLQTSVVSGHKADFALMLMDPDPLRIESIHQRLLACPLGPALDSTYSFVSLTEISEYVPTVEQYAARLVHEGETPGSPAYEAKVKAYEGRLPAMNRQRLKPEFPAWPATCFYPMNKSRVVGANWFTERASQRQRMMSEHARSGMAFAGKVSQLITVSVGLDDWEWGVTLWARNPQFLKDIVYQMRFDEASAKYAEFGEFYVSYIQTPAEMLDHCRIGA